MIESAPLPDYDRAPTNPHHGGKYSYNQWLQALIDGSVICKETIARGTDPGSAWFVERYNESTSVEDTITAILLLRNAKKGQSKVVMTPMSKTVRWMRHTMKAIHKCGGHPDFIDKFPEDLMEDMIRNDLHVIHKKDVE